jgi:murein DD-endopeptidase MepM/ murein hydrolase activator NlpD
MLLRRYRVVVITCGLVFATLCTSLLVRRQTALLSPVSAAPVAPTTPPERQFEPTPEAPSEALHDHVDVPTPVSGTAVPPPAAPRSALIDQQRFFYEPDFYATHIQAYLETQPGPLKSYRTMVGSREHSFAEILASQTSLYSINPKVVLALIEQQSGMLTTASPSEEQQKFMLGFRSEEEKREGWLAQLRWAIRELHRAQRDYPSGPELAYADKSHSALPSGMTLVDYAIARVLAATTTADALPTKLDGGSRSFVATYTRLFSDPRDPPIDWPEPAAPFLSLPMEAPHETTSFFDHDTPFLSQSGSIVTYRGDRDEQLSYDGHDGWDYGMLPPEPVLAAADGTVVFAGNSDDGCGVAKVVIIDHGNGYRTLYWHLTQPTVEVGPVERGQQIGTAGSSGCATGPHLHFQVQYLGHDTDPAGWCGPRNADPWAAHPAGQISTWLWQDVPSPCALPENAIVVDTTDPGFRRLGVGWTELAQGIGGTALNVMSSPPTGSRLTVGVWRPALPRAGRYRVLAWVPYVANGLKDAGRARYVVGHADGSGDTQQISISQADTANWWADLGVHLFDPQRAPFVGLAANDSESGNNVWYDAIIWIPMD